MVNFDLSKVLHVVEVEVRFNSSFSDFERREKDKEERNQREWLEEREKKKTGELQGEKEQKGVIFPNNNSTTTTRIESKEEVKKSKEGEEKVLTNPTGKGIRNDSGGLGHFGASRGVDSNGKKRLHEGLDFQSVEGQDVVSPIQGKAINSFFFKDKKKTIKIPTIVITPTDLNIGFNKLELLYVGPIEERWRNVNPGDIVGQSVNLQSLGYPSSVGQHVHLQIKLNGIIVDPRPYFPGLK